jgi:FkbM family methyltransferase
MKIADSKPEDQIQKSISAAYDISSSFGYYSLKGVRKILFNLAQKLPRNTFGFKTALVLRKLTLQNRVKIVDETQFGFRLRLYPLDNLGDRFLLFMPKFYEYNEFALMSEILKPDSVFIDIGGNMGIYSFMAAKNINQTGRILSFEPNPVMVERFQFNRMINGLDRLIEIYPIGIADKESTISLSLPGKNMGGASIVVEHGEDHVMIKCRPLLDVLGEQNIRQIDVLKIDIEKADSLALKPFLEKAPGDLFPKMIFIESDEDINLAEFGYKFISRSRSLNSVYRLEQRR